MLFDCHIHVDIVTATACVKYLFKYVHKGEDYAKARIQGITDEIELYRKTRYISAAEATWRLLGFQMIDRYPAVTKITRAPRRRAIRFVPLLLNPSSKPGNYKPHPLTSHELFRTPFSFVFRRSPSPWLLRAVHRYHPKKKTPLPCQLLPLENS